jgi:hypothetical protein
MKAILEELVQDVLDQVKEKARSAKQIESGGIRSTERKKIVLDANILSQIIVPTCNKQMLKVLLLDLLLMRVYSEMSYKEEDFSVI